MIADPPTSSFANFTTLLHIDNRNRELTAVGLPTTEVVMFTRNRIFQSFILLCVCTSIQAQDIELDLQMPADTFSPGVGFSLDLNITNTGSSVSDAQLFVALTVGTGAFWFYPGWVTYPPDVDFEVTSFPAEYQDIKTIIPEFAWPSGAGEFSGALFYAAVVSQGNLISNLADITFNWTSGTPFTPTPNPSHPVSVGNMIPVIAGAFLQGSPEDEICRSGDEVQFSHTLVRNFLAMGTEVSRQMWADLKAVQPTLPSDSSNTDYSPTMNHPANRITWYEAILFANVLSLQNGYTRCYYTNASYTVPVDRTNYSIGPFFCDFNANGYRLPTEGEWEFMTRAGTQGPFFCQEPDYNASNCNSAIEGTHAVLEQYCVYHANAGGSSAVIGSKLPNPIGLNDTLGNVFEWVWDWYSEEYPTGAASDYRGPSTGEKRIIRGGAWGSSAAVCRCARRYDFDPNTTTFSIGFRLVRTAP